MNIQDGITSAIIKLYESERFYAEIVLNMTRIISKEVPTAGVRVKDNVELVINPDFFLSLSPDERVAILKHECQHILNDHIPRFKELAPGLYDKKAGEISTADMHTRWVMNVAADMSINAGITSLPQGAVYPKTFNLPDGETCEWYHTKIKEDPKMQQAQTVDDHGIWSESDGCKEEIKAKIQTAVNKAAQKTRGAGKMSSDQELLVSRLNYKPSDWRSTLRRFAARRLEYVIDSSRKKRNRRYGIAYPGVIKTPSLHLGVAIDTSGSISDEEINQFMAEISNIAKHAQVTVVEADSEIKNTYIFDPKKTYSVKGRGGTAYQPAFDFFNETDIDGMIYFGDMDCFDIEVIKKPKYPVIWAVVGQQAPPVEWGSRVKVEVRTK